MVSKQGLFRPILVGGGDDDGDDDDEFTWDYLSPPLCFKKGEKTSFISFSERHLRHSLLSGKITVKALAKWDFRCITETNAQKV